MLIKCGVKEAKTFDTGALQLVDFCVHAHKMALQWKTLGAMDSTSIRMEKISMYIALLTLKQAVEYSEKQLLWVNVPEMI